MTWQPGRDKIAGLLAAGELEQVVADGDVARRLDDAGRHLTTAATATAGGDMSGAYQLAYDAFRKSAASLLAIQGLRATSRGGHIAIQDAVGAQFGASVPAFRSFGRIRRARNSFEYPTADTPGPSADDVDDAVTTATRAREAVVTRWHKARNADSERAGSNVKCGCGPAQTSRLCVGPVILPRVDQSPRSRHLCACQRSCVRSRSVMLASAAVFGHWPAWAGLDACAGRPGQGL